MRNKIIKWLSVTLALLLCFLGSTEAVNVQAAVKLNKTSLTLTVGQSKQLKLLGKTKNVKWTSNKKTVAIVSQKGKVTGKKAGKAVITAKYANKKYSCKVTVKHKTDKKVTVRENGIYDSKEEVALYLSIYKKLPSNYITKKEANALGWSGGGLDDYAYGKCIGGDYFGNYEEKLPVKKGRSYYECDIDTLHANSRGAKRIVYSNDGLIYYTEDHYETFVLLYGKE